MQIHTYGGEYIFTLCYCLELSIEHHRLSGTLMTTHTRTVHHLHHHLSQLLPHVWIMFIVPALLQMSRGDGGCFGRVGSITLRLKPVGGGGGGGGMTTSARVGAGAIVGGRDISSKPLPKNLGGGDAQSDSVIVVDGGGGVSPTNVGGGRGRITNAARLGGDADDGEIGGGHVVRAVGGGGRSMRGSTCRVFF